MKTQCDIIEDILKRDGQIDNFYAWEHRFELGTRLAARIADLEKKGYVFDTDRVGKNYVYKVVKYPAAKQLSLV